MSTSSILGRSLQRLTGASHAKVPRATFGSSAARSAKEDSLHQEGHEKEVEHHKQDQLQKQKEGKGHWKDELASNSESIIKADRGEVEASADTIEKLQKESEELLKKSGKQ